MTAPLKNRTIDSRKGYTLIELTLILTVLLGLISILFFGTKAYKQGANRAICIQNQAAMQRAVRSFSNLHGLEPGDRKEDLKSHVVGPGKLITTEPTCPQDGSYTFGGDIVPEIGVLYLRCDIESHVPASHDGW